MPIRTGIISYLTLPTAEVTTKPGSSSYQQDGYMVIWTAVCHCFAQLFPLLTLTSRSTAIIITNSMLLNSGVQCQRCHHPDCLTQISHSFVALLVDTRPENLRPFPEGQKLILSTGSRAYPVVIGCWPLGIRLPRCNANHCPPYTVPKVKTDWSCFESKWPYHGYCFSRTFIMAYYKSKVTEILILILI